MIGQEINFGGYYNYSVTVTPETGGILDFGTILTDEGIVNIDITDPSVAVYSIEGVKYLDAFVTISSPGFLYLDGNSGCPDSTCRIPFEVKAAYANRGVNNALQSVELTGSVNNIFGRFPIRYRGAAPPGPPPTPVYEGYLPNAAINLDTAYLYIYGQIDVASHIVGTYSSNVTIAIDYE
ncbi:MAG: hypothetical protein BalsKO_08610 [Balneolaceae bacterium]